MRPNSGVSFTTTDASPTPFPLPRTSSSCAARAAIALPEPSRHLRGFTIVDRRRAVTVADLDAAAVHDVLLSIYRTMQPQPPEAMRVTFGLDLLLFRPA